ncbi:ankyrin repeat and BTB/POZ domain-containing protein 1 [Eurytemora carolleeae]|uniref:ankyrin repeat and BTB/POZ domain-containing protein 1 n=1 Tax=Eurytemora carolleeae TaxID=1294199 RepID=UPI000C76E412|nr:ankyrin repeat and BTB/POZ domain-containing protein 1 [Eurytemora carolleeae]|eukprot:XP_023341091.1 ankyrin repeat and BTB/POZ domain-containing protein 1-like [Eurytemora affinis]
MSVAEMFLLPGLKRECGNWLIRYIDADTVLPILRSSRLYSLPRLEDACTAYIADNIEQFVGNEDLNELVMEDAKSVKERQETDSIPVIDDIRSHIRLGVRTLADVAEAEIKIQFLESILENLGLDA